MIIELDNGLRSKYWWTPYNISGTEDPIQAAYLAIRQRCPFLTDDNHILGSISVTVYQERSIENE